MEKFVITGGKPLKGTVTVGGAKNVAMKVILAGLLTEEPITVHNVPQISSVLGTTKIVEPLGVHIKHINHTLHIKAQKLTEHKVPLELGGLFRTAPMVMGPLLARFGHAVVPNPGGCRLGKRPINRHIEALSEMGAQIEYKAGYFVGTGKLHGARINFEKNTHTGTETIILAAVLADGETIIENAAQEPEVDDLITMLNQMGASIHRSEKTITIKGVKSLGGTEFSIMPDRNEVVTWVACAIATGGDIVIHGTQRQYLKSFLASLDLAGGGWEAVDATSTRFYWKEKLKATQIITLPHPGFMTDWQAPWAVLMTQAQGTSSIHETVFESRFSYVSELRKMGAKIDFFDPEVKSPQTVYNFDWKDRIPGYHQGIKIHGPTPLHEAVVEITDLRAGATLVVASLAAKGESVLLGVEHIDRGYEQFDEQLIKLGATVKRMEEDL